MSARVTRWIPLAFGALAGLLAAHPARGAEMVTLDDLRDCRRIISMSIKYSWLKDADSRIFSKHHFVFLDGEYGGYAYCAVKSPTVQDVRKIDGLNIPLGVMEAVTIILRGSPLRPIDVAPAVPSAVGRPHHEISLELCTEEVKFYNAVVDGKETWVLAVGGQNYAVGNDAPQSAIKVLEPFMHFDMVEELKESVFGEVRPVRAGKPVPGEKAATLLREMEETPAPPSKPGRPPDPPRSMPRPAGRGTEKAVATVPPPLKNREYDLVRAPRPFETIYFDTASYEVAPRYNLALFGMIDYLRSHQGVEVLVTGHCDERGDESFNFALGEKRASSVASLLINRGADPSAVKLLSHGEQRPVDSGHSEEAWRKNRRVEFHFYEYRD